MSKVLLREYYELCEGGVCQDLLTEAEKRFVAEGGMILSGIMQKADTQNGNGRVYPARVLMREVENYKKLVKERRALGELDHPDDSVINLRNASHMVTDVWFEGKDVMGKVQVLNTPSGNILRSLVESGVKLGISSRGMGSVSESQGATVVEDDFQLICFDFVSEPSTPNAFMMREAKEFGDSNVFTKADKINRLLNDIIGDYK
ncbi:MAG: primosomal protein [Legionellales bacterium]|nr:primosomal protein [Legionellales bacterium]